MWPVPESTPGWTAQVLENQGQVRRCVREENRNGREQREKRGGGGLGKKAREGLRTCKEGDSTS